MKILVEYQIENRIKFEELIISLEINVLNLLGLDKSKQTDKFKFEVEILR